MKIHFGEFEKGPGCGVIRATLSEFRGRDLVDVRFYVEGDDGRLTPTKKGVAFGLDRLADFLDLARKMQEYAVEHDLIETAVEIIPPLPNE